MLGPAPLMHTLSELMSSLGPPWDRKTRPSSLWKVDIVTLSHGVQVSHLASNLQVPLPLAVWQKFADRLLSTMCGRLAHPWRDGHFCLLSLVLGWLLVHSWVAPVTFSWHFVAGCSANPHGQVGWLCQGRRTCLLRALYYELYLWVHHFLGEARKVVPNHHQPRPRIFCYNKSQLGMPTRPVGVCAQICRENHEVCWTTVFSVMVISSGL
jgi:hypothetical protein